MDKSTKTIVDAYEIAIANKEKEISGLKAVVVELKDLVYNLTPKKN